IVKRKSLGRLLRTRASHRENPGGAAEHPPRSSHSALSRSSPPTFAWSVTAVALSPAIPPTRGPHSGFPDQGGKFPDRRFKFPVRPQIIPCSDAQGIGP